MLESHSQKEERRKGYRRIGDDLRHYKESLHYQIQYLIPLFSEGRLQFFPLAEDGRADAHHRCAFFYCNLKIVAHAHRQFCQLAFH